jgi:hypothetical protein
LAEPESEKIVDAIPLYQVEEVVDMNFLDFERPNGKKKNDRPQYSFVLDETGESETEKKCGDSNKVKFKNTVQIRTIQDGYNSGRKYYIQARSEAECQEIAGNLKKYAAHELEKFLAKTRFEKAQEFVRNYYTSTACQSAVALLIIAVSRKLCIF